MSLTDKEWGEVVKRSKVVTFNGVNGKEVTITLPDNYQVAHCICELSGIPKRKQKALATEKALEEARIYWELRQLFAS